MKQSVLLLTYLKAILAGGSITKGAENLFVSQPYLSKFISDSEAELGFELLNRKTRPVSLTKEGSTYIQGIENLNNDYEILLNQVSRISSTKVKDLRIGINQSMASIVAAPLLYRYRQKFPDEKISISEDRSNELEQELLHRKIDLHIRMLPSFPAEIGYTFLTEIPVYLIINKTSPLFEKGNSKIRTVDLNNPDLKDMDLISISSGSGFMRLVELFLGQKSISIRPTLEVKYIETAANLAYQGLGCTFVPKYFVNSSFNASLCNIIHIPKHQLSLKIVISYLKENYSEQQINKLIKATNICELISSMNLYQYREILK